jgi:hypothetical protein
MTDRPIALSADHVIDDAVITLADQPTELSGVVVDASGLPLPDCVVVVFPADRTLWRSGTLRIQIVRPDHTGRYVIAGLPPGAYAIAVASDVDPDSVADPDTLGLLLAATTVRVSIGSREKRVQDLRIGR